MPSHFRAVQSDPLASTVAMALDGELTGRGLRNALLSPQRLTPLEREGIAQRIGADHGKVAGALAETLMNPWVWLTFLTTPGAAKALRSGNRIFSTNMKYVLWGLNSPTMMMRAGGNSPNQLLRGTNSAASGAQHTEVFEKLKLEATQDLAPANAWLKSRGFNGWNAGKTDSERRYLKMVQGAIAARLHGFEETAEVAIPVKFHKKMIGNEKYVVKELGDPENPLRFAWRVKQVERRLDGTELQTFIDREGLGPVVDSIRKTLDKRMGLLYLDDTGKVDPLKSAQLLRAAKSQQVMGVGGKQVDGVRMIRQLLGDNVMELVQSGRVSQADFDHLLSFVAEKSLQRGRYFPLNVRQAYDASGKVRSAEWFKENRTARKLHSTGSAIPRMKTFEQYDPETLRLIGQEFGGNEVLEKQIQRIETMVARRQTKGQPYQLNQLDVEKSLENYLNDSAHIHARYQTAPNDEVRALTEDMWADAARSDWQLSGERVGISEFQKGLPINQSWVDLEKAGKAPIGGWTLADVDFQTWAVIPNEYARRVHTYMIDLAMGKRNVRHTMTLAAMQQAKLGLLSIAEGPIGKMLDGLGDWGKKTRAELYRLSDASLLDNASASHSARALATGLYVSHLGLNLGSMVLNMTQPFLLASVGLGTDDVLRGYKDAFEEMSGYAKERFARYGLRPITESQRRELVHTHFKFAALTGIGPDAVHALDETLSGASHVFKQGSRADRFVNFMLKGFEKTEWMNRTVTGHAVKHAYRKAGLVDDVAVNPRLRADIREFVEETQFGASARNLPMAFQTTDPELAKAGVIFSNPLMRQFFQFQFKSLYQAWHLPTQIGNATRTIAGMEVKNAGLVRALDFARGMGISAVMIGVGRNLLGVDLERAGFYRATTDLAVGRFDARNPEDTIPLPPVLDIPRGLVMGLIEGDHELLRRSAARMVPGGVALGRLSSAVGLPPFNTRTVGWGDVDEQGKVGVYELDGRLIERVAPLHLAMRGVGVPLSQDADERELNSSLIANSKEISMYRGEFVRAIRTGNVSKANSLKREFQRRFGVPLTVSESRIRSALETEMTPRTARQAQRLSSDLQRLYGPWLSGRAASPTRQPSPTPRSDDFAPNPQAQRLLEAAKKMGGGDSEQAPSAQSSFENFGAF